MQKIRLKPGQTVGLKMTAEEREILIESMPFPDAVLEEKIRAADAGAQEVRLTLPELSGLANCLAAQLKQTGRNRKLGIRLNRIEQRIRQVEDLFEPE